MPRHVAFIMDGNRRYARRHAMKTVLDGHSLGFETLAKTLEWCRELDITEVTVYAFSIENFKRSEDEVNGLMDLARQKFQKLLDEKDQIQKHGVRFRFLGNISMLPIDMQRLIAQIELLSMENDRAFFNVCIAYTSQDEIGRALADVANGVQEGLLEPNDVDEALIDGCLDSRHSPNPDLLIRTSGELRFSDFLLWQCSHSCVYFDNVLWPDYSFKNLCFAILHYQRSVGTINKMKALHFELAEVEDEKMGLKEGDGTYKRRHEFVKVMDERKLNSLRAMCATNGTA
jgi:ditrans,polycis-polyprenyl diphosphate synthase